MRSPGGTDPGGRAAPGSAPHHLACSRRSTSFICGPSWFEVGRAPFSAAQRAWARRASSIRRRRVIANGALICQSPGGRPGGPGIRAPLRSGRAPGARTGCRAGRSAATPSATACRPRRRSGQPAPPGRSRHRAEVRFLVCDPVPAIAGASSVFATEDDSARGSAAGEGKGWHRQRRPAYHPTLTRDSPLKNRATRPVIRFRLSG